jgi:hypothetical protein
MVVRQVRAEIKQLGASDTAPGLAAVAVRLALALDAIDPSDAPTSQAVVADKLAMIMIKLRALAPPVTKGDAVDDLTEQRDKRRAEARRRRESD